jgi:hypothetical protein
MAARILLLVAAATALVPPPALPVATRLYHAGGHGPLEDDGYEGDTMQLLREAPSYDVASWLDMHEGEAPVCGVYALFEGDDCAFVGRGEDAVAAIREVRAELEGAVTLKIEEHAPEESGVLSLLFGSWLDEASPDGARPRINAARSAAKGL